MFRVTEKKKVGREIKASHSGRAQAQHNKRHTIATSSHREFWAANDGVGTSSGSRKRGRSAFGRDGLEADEQQSCGSSRFALRPRSQKRPRYAESEDEDEDEEVDEKVAYEPSGKRFEEGEEEAVIGGARAGRRVANRIASHDPEEATATKHSPQVAVEFSDEY